MEREQWETISCLNVGAPALHTHTHGRWVTWMRVSAGWINSTSSSTHAHMTRLRTCGSQNSGYQPESSLLSLSLAVNHNISPHLSLSTPRCTIHPRILCFHYRRRDALLTRCLFGPHLYLKWPRPASHSHHTFRTDAILINTLSSLHPLYIPAFPLK